MSALLAALQRLEGRSRTAPRSFASTTSSSSVRVTQPFVEPVRSTGWDEVVLPVAEETVSAANTEPDEGAAALVSLVPAPALIAVVAVGVADELPSLLRRFGEAVSARTENDVVLLGPGMLDDAERLAAQWATLRSQVGYGLVHAPAERAMLRPDALRQTTGVVAVVEVGSTPIDAVKTFRTWLAEQGIPLLGTLAIRDAA